MLRFMADEYDDTCSTIFPLLQTVLINVRLTCLCCLILVLIVSQYKRSKKVASVSLDESTRSFLASLLDVILQKMRWNKDDDPNDMDEDDITAFELLRKVILF